MKERYYNVVPECYADTVLVEMLGFVRPNHAPNSNVSQVLKVIKHSRPNMKMVGIIDSDRGKSEKLLKKQLEGFALEEEKNGIKRYVFGNHTILVLCPALEVWIFNNTSAKTLKKIPYGFENPKYFRKVCKSSKNGKAKDQLKNFLNTLKNAPGFTQLKTWICEGAGINEADI